MIKLQTVIYMSITVIDSLNSESTNIGNVTYLLSSRKLATSYPRLWHHLRGIGKSRGGPPTLGPAYPFCTLSWPWTRRLHSKPHERSRVASDPPDAFDGRNVRTLAASAFISPYQPNSQDEKPFVDALTDILGVAPGDHLHLTVL